LRLTYDSNWSVKNEENIWKRIIYYEQQKTKFKKKNWAIWYFKLLPNQYNLKLKTYEKPTQWKDDLINLPVMSPEYLTLIGWHEVVVFMCPSFGRPSHKPWSATHSLLTDMAIIIHRHRKKTWPKCLALVRIINIL